jgi:hypothetical protein
MQIDDSTLKWLLGGLTASITSLLAATWRTSRRSKEAEDAIARAAALEVYVLGDELEGKSGLIQQVREAREAALYAARGIRLLFRAFRVPAEASDREVIEQVRGVSQGEVHVQATGQHEVYDPSKHGPLPREAPPPRRPIGPFRVPIPREDGDDDD